MGTLREWVIRFWGTLRASRRDANLEEELRVHLELAAEDDTRRCSSTGPAGRAAVIRSGGLAQAMEALREQRGLPWLDGLRRDLHDAWRAIARSRGFTVVVIATLGAALALCLTVVSVINAYLIRPLPYPNADRLYRVVVASPGMDLPEGLDEIEWASLDDAVEQRIAWDLDMFYLLGGTYPEAAPGTWVTPGFVQGFGLRAERGRVLEPADFAPGNPTAVMISHRLWVSRYGSDPDIVGRTLRAYVSDRPDEPETLTVVGVLPGDFWHFNMYTDVVAPLRAPAHPYLVKLRHSADVKAVADRITTLVHATSNSLPKEWRATLVPMQAHYTEEMRPLVKALALAASLVFLIACGNVAVLLLVRAARRRHETAIRLALGASRARLARLLGLEALLLGGAATALGLAATALTTRALAPVVEQRLRRLPGGETALSLDGTLLVAALALGLLVTLALTLAPLVTLWSTAVAHALKTGGRGTTDGRATRRLRSVLTACEVAAALTLLVGSVLMVQSAVRMLRADPGFRADGVLTTGVTLRARAYADATSRAGFYSNLLRRLGEHTGGGSVALGDGGPLFHPRPIPLQRLGESAVTAEAGLIPVSAGYFATLGIQFRDGASFTDEDRVGGEPVAVVSESLARRLWPKARAVGQYVRIPRAGAEAIDTAPGTPHLVVGVVQDMARVEYDDGRVHAGASALDVYVPLLQEAGRFTFLYARGFAGTPEMLRAAIAQRDPGAAVESPASLAAAVHEARRGPSEIAWMLSTFAAFAVLLALLGVYSVIAYGVRQREREIGVRLVVGATPRAVTRLFVREGSPLVACGLAVGLVGAAVLGTALRNQLFGVQPIEPSILAATTALFGVCAGLALWWPARRAARVEPADVLKDE